MAKIALILTEQEEKGYRHTVFKNKDYLNELECAHLFEELDATREKLQEFRRSEKKSGEAYLRIRAKLNAWQTPEGPTTEQVYEHTEKKLYELIEAAIGVVGKEGISEGAHMCPCNWCNKLREVLEKLP